MWPGGIECPLEKQFKYSKFQEYVEIARLVIRDSLAEIVKNKEIMDKIKQKFQKKNKL